MLTSQNFASQSDALQFGFVPGHVVASLQDIGNWKSRATAIDALQRSLLAVDSKAQLLPGLQPFLAFLMHLVNDPNFKISVSSMEILGDVVAKVGSDLGAHLRSIVPALVERLSDSKVIVRSGIMKVLKKLMAATGPLSVLELLSPGLQHHNARVTEEVINSAIIAMLSFSPKELDYMHIGNFLLEPMATSEDRIRLVSLEAFAVAHSQLGSSKFQNLLSAMSPPHAQLAMIKQRLNNPMLPFINAEGMVEHHVDLQRAPMGNISSPAMGPSYALASNVPNGLGLEDVFGGALFGSAADASVTSETSTKQQWETSGPRSRGRERAGSGSSTRMHDESLCEWSSGRIQVASGPSNGTVYVPER